MLPKGDILLPAKKVSRKRDTDGNSFGIANENPILDTRICEIQFPDRHTELYAANIIVEDVYSQVDHEGNQFLLLEIIDHHCNEKVITIPNEYVNLPGGQCLKKMTTQSTVERRYVHLENTMGFKREQFDRGC